MHRFVSALAALSVATLAGAATAHIHIQDPPPINTVNQLKNSPCGCIFGDGTAQGCDDGFMVTSVPETGELVVTWKETVLHPGNFRISASDKAPDAVVEADFEGAAVLMEFVDDNETQNADVTQTVTLPPGTRVVQVRQEMTDDPADPYYYSCAAVEVMAPGTTSATSATGATTAVATTSAAVTVAAATSGGDPVYEPEPDDSGCAVRAGAHDESGWSLGIAVAVAAGFLALRKRA